MQHRMRVEKVEMQSAASSTDYGLISVDSSYEESLARAACQPRSTRHSFSKAGHALSCVCRVVGHVRLVRQEDMVFVMR